MEEVGRKVQRRAEEGKERKGRVTKAESVEKGGREERKEERDKGRKEGGQRLP